MNLNGGLGICLILLSGICYGLAMNFLAWGIIGIASEPPTAYGVPLLCSSGVATIIGVILMVIVIKGRR